MSSNNSINNTIGAEISGVTNTLTVTNPSDTASSASRTTIVVGGASADDPSLNFNVSSVTSWELGIDNSDSDSFKISQGSALGTNDTFIMTTSGERTMPLQPAFLASLTTTQSNVTGDSTEYTIPFDATIIDQGSDFDTGTGTFTAPITGSYLFQSQVLFGNLSSSTTQVIFRFETSNRNYNQIRAGGSIRDVFDQVELVGSTLSDMDAGDTMNIVATALGTTKVVSIIGTSLNTYVSGLLMV